MNIKHIACIGVLLAAQTTTSYGAPGEGIVLDANGDYIITYQGLAGKLLQSKFVPATKIEPAVQATFSVADSGLVNYRYSITNSVAAKQPIITIRIRDITRLGDKNSMPTVQPTPWNGDALPNPDGGSAIWVDWSVFIGLNPDESKLGIPPGKKQSGFGYASSDLPGIGKIRMGGYTPIEEEGYEDEGPQGEVGEQAWQLEKNDYVTRRAAVPAIAVPTPFDAALLLERIQTHVHIWIGMKLLDPAFSAQLDTSFKAAIDAYRSNQPKAGKSAIKTLRELLKKAYPDLDNEDIVDEETGNNKPVLSKVEGGAQFKNGMIARLPARVLDFDLKYVLKQVGDE